MTALIAAAPAAAQNALFDSMQYANQATAIAAQTTAQATSQAQQNIGQAQQQVQAARANPGAAAQAALAPAPTPAPAAAATAPAAQATSVPATNCSNADSPLQFRACLALTQHHNASWQAAHPTVAKAKTGPYAATVGVRPQRIMPTPQTHN